MQEEMPVLEQTDAVQADSDKSVKKLSKKVIITAVVVIAVLGALFYFKGLFVAASVDGSFISRLSVIKKVESENGKSVLESLITEQLIKNEVKNKGIVVTDEEINEEIASVDARLSQQGTNLKDALAQRGMTEKSFREQVKLQKEVEKLLADKIQVKDDEVSKYILANKVPVTKDNEAEVRKQVTDQIRNQRLNTEAPAWISALKTEAKIKYYVNY